MRMTTDQLKSGWIHPRRVVRNAVAHRFRHSFTTDPDVTAQAIRSVREFGWQGCLTWPHMITDLPLADDAAFDWVCGEVERTDEAAPTSNLKRHLTGMLSRADIDIVERHRSRLLTLSALRPRERDAVLMRLERRQCDPAEVWRRLEEHCRMAAAAEAFTPPSAASAFDRRCPFDEPTAMIYKVYTQLSDAEKYRWRRCNGGATVWRSASRRGSRRALRCARGRRSISSARAT